MKKLITLILLLVGGVSMVHANNYLVVGASIVCNNEDWNNDAAVNLMQTSDEGATYTLTIENLTLETGVNYEYKIVEKGSWTEYYPNTGHNASFSVDKTAVYTIKYTYTVSTSTCDVTTTKTGEAGAISHTYNIAGNSVALFGAEWDETNTATDMSYDDVKKIYTWENSDVALTAGNIEFKVTQDHAWGVSYPGENYQLAIPSDGTYKVTITFNKETKAVSATAIKKNTYTVTFVNGKKWENVSAYVWNETGGVVVITDPYPGNPLGKPTGTRTINGEDFKVYTYSYDTYDNAPEWIIFNDGTNSDDNKTGNLAFENGKQYTETVTFIPVYAVVGSNVGKTDKAIFSGNWDVANTTDILTKVGDYWTISFNNVTLTDAIIFKVIMKAYLEATEAAAWYPAGVDNDMTIAAGQYGGIVINFDGTTASFTTRPTTETFTVSAEGWATAKATYAVDFTGVEGIEAYTATVSENTVTLHKVGPVPAGTALVLKGETKEVPTIESANDVSNDLHWYTTYTVNDEHRHVYGLVKGTDEKAQFTRVNNGQVITNKAILELDPSASRELKVVFDDETTGISQIENTQPATKTDGAIYNLNGQRVMNPGKGLYIINGKKVIMK